MNDQKRRRTRGIGLLIVVLAVGLAALAGITLLQLMDAGPVTGVPGRDVFGVRRGPAGCRS